MENYLTLGDLARAFFKALDIKYSIEVNRLCKEDDIDMGKIKEVIIKYYKETEIYDSRFDSLKDHIYEELKPFKLNKELSKLTDEMLLDTKELLKISNPVDSYIEIRGEKLLLNQNMVATLADNFFYIYKWYNRIINEYFLYTSSKERNKFFIQNLYIPILRRIFIEFEKEHKLELLFDYNDLEVDLFEQIRNNILKKSGLENYTFLKFEEEDSLYRFIIALGKKHNLNDKLLEVSEELMKNKEIIKSGLTKETLLLNFMLARLYRTFLKEVKADLREKPKYFEPTDLVSIYCNLDSFSKISSNRLTLDKANKIDELKRLVKSDKESKSIEEFETLYTSLKKEVPEMRWFLEHCYSEHLVFQQKYSQALNHYLVNLKETSYKAGSLFKRYFKEALTLAVYLNDRVAFKKVYRKAYIHLFVEKKLEVVWDCYTQKDYMDYFFPKDYYYKI